MTTSATASPSPYAVFRHAPFTRLWLAQFVSQFGSSLTIVAAGLMVYRQTGSALSVGLLLAVTIVPSLLLGLLAGTVVDRYDRRHLMIAADVARAALVALIPLLVVHGAAWLYVLVLLSGVATQFFDPAFEAVLPESAPEKELDAANTLMMVSTTAAQTLGFAVAGLISIISVRWAFALDAMTFLLSAALLSGLRMRALPVLPESRPLLKNAVAEVRAGLGVVQACAPLRSTFAVTALALFFLGLFNALTLPFALRALHAGSVVYSLLEGAPAVGTVVGGLLLVHVTRRLQPGQWMTVSLLGMGALLALVGTLTSVPWAIALLTILGVFNIALSYARRTIFQREVPPEARGRVGSALFVVRDVALVLGALAAGLADVLSVSLLVVITGTLLVGTGLLACRLPGLSSSAAVWWSALMQNRAIPSER